MKIDLTAVPDRETLKEMVKHALDNAAFTKLDEVRVEVAEGLLQIGELSKSTLGNYINKATTDSMNHTRQAERRRASFDDTMKRAKDPKKAFARAGNMALANHDMEKQAMHNSKSMKRERGIAKAVSKLVHSK